MARTSYPVHFAVDYPDRQLDRLSTLLRVFYAIPILILVGTLESGSAGFSWDSASETDASTGATVFGGLLILPPLLMILFRQKYPRWWFDFNLELMRFSNRIGVYMALMDDRYPSTDEEQSVHLDVAYPDVPRDLNRWLPLVKWLLAIPHYIVLFFLAFAVIFGVIFAWFAILFTGHYPRWIFEFVEGVTRWGNRVAAYAFMLATDQYPPFSLD
jgi:hypothetical protein